MAEDPWHNMAAPSATETVTAKRVNAQLKWDFFWAIDIGRNCHLILKYTPTAIQDPKVPKLRGVELSRTRAGLDGRSSLVFKLLDASHREIFASLCRDIVQTASMATSEAEAVRLTLARTWLWHHLLRSGVDARLSLEEQQGLLGELFVLDRYLLPNLLCEAAVSAWRGPLGAPKDFDIGSACIEVKTTRGAEPAYLQVTSEHQLDTSFSQLLFLFVIQIDRAMSAPPGRTLTEVASRVRERINLQDPGTVSAYEAVLAAAGFRWTDDYSDTPWTEGLGRFYSVGGDFPRIVANHVAPGISNVKYSISLSACRSFQIDDAKFISAINGSTNGH